MVILQSKPKATSTGSESFKSKVKIAISTQATCNTKDVEIAVTLIYLSNVWRTPEILLINSKINHIAICSANCLISAANGATEFAITDTKLYIPVAAVPAKHNPKLLQKIKSGFKRTINWNKYQSKVTIDINIIICYIT